MGNQGEGVDYIPEFILCWNLIWYKTLGVVKLGDQWARQILKE
jgi:hypothetical protein